MTALPTFDAFYRALHERDPFPWQVALADRVATEGWPDLLDLPTGTGKTSALDVALHALACRPDASPRRVVLVVDRRIVVDQGADHARSIRRKMMAATSGPVKAVADALRALTGASGEAPPFAVAVLRGGAPRDDDWAKRPDMPVLGVSTVDQVGSRLLFRGYGISPKLASVHAGLLGRDTLVLLDEVHLSIPFAETLRAVRDRYDRSSAGLPAKLKVVEMSATPIGTPRSSTMALTEADRVHPVVRQRLEAHKPARLVEVAVRGEEHERRHRIAQIAAEETNRLRAAGAKTIGVVLNRVDTARRTFDALQGAGRVVLVTGRMRPIDRDRVVATELPHATAGRDRAGAEPIIVVATQCIEAGADLDFDALVTELASFDALKQRFGRLDRRGDVTLAKGKAEAVILARADVLGEKADDPIYGSALAATWTFLVGRAQQHVVDMGVRALADRPAPPEIAATLVVAPTHAPILMPGHVEAWTQTSPLLRPEPDPDVALFLHGPERASAEVHVVWRADISLADLDPEAAREDREDGLQESLALVRPSSLEALPLPLASARAWLCGDDVPAVADVSSEAAPEARGRPRPDSSLVGLVRRGELWERVRASDLRPGDAVVVPAERGGLTAGSFDPMSQVPVLDVGDLAQLRARGILSVRTHPDAMRWLTQSPAPTPDEEGSTREDRVALEAFLRALPDAPPPLAGVREAEWSRIRRAKLTRSPAVVRSREGQEALDTFVIAQRLPPTKEDDVEVGEAYSDDDRSSFTAAAASLQRHSADVRGKAVAFSRTLGLPQTVADDVALAAWLHDVGKVDPRFQMLLAGGDEVRLAALVEPQAKSRLPNMSASRWRRVAEHAKLPEGYRHELASLAMIERDPEVRARAHDLDLVLHLVASHHGWCRPFAPAVPTSTDGLSPSLSFQLDGGASGARLALRGDAGHSYASLDGGVADRFWRVQERYGPWGLAWLEAILRLADHRASEELEAGGTSP